MIGSVLPWILFFTLSGHTQQQMDIAISVAAITSIAFEFKGLKKGFVLSWGTLLFFIFMFITVVIGKNQYISQYSWIFSNGALAIIAWASILIRKPFTIQYAKERVPRDKWNQPLFIKINYVLTAVWGLIFLMNIGLHVLSLYYPSFNRFYGFVSYMPSIFGILFTLWFPNWYKEKHTGENT